MISNSVACIGAVLLIVTSSSGRAPCTPPESCIQLETCTYLYNMLLKKPLTEAEKGFLRRSQCGSSNGKVYVCCRNEQQPEITMRASLPEPGVCGMALSNRIHGGTIAKIDDFPWMALIYYDKGNEINHQCGGSLINNRYVLTAAHCILRIPSYWRILNVRLGEWNTATARDCEVDKRGYEECTDGHVDIPIESIITHQNYVTTGKSKNVPHDIALIRLSRSVEFTDFIKPICLPVKENLRDISFDGIAMDIAGWGYTEYNTSSDVKLKTVVHGTPLGGCTRLYREYDIHLQSSQICAGGQKGIDSCQGDSGGGLFAMDTSNKSLKYNYIAGVTSFGPNPCGLQGWPGVYTRVNRYIDWIKQNIKP